MAENIYKKREACRRLQISARKLNRLIETGQLPVLRAGPHVRIRESVLMAFAAAAAPATEGQR